MCGGATINYMRAKTESLVSFSKPKARVHGEAQGLNKKQVNNKPLASEIGPGSGGVRQLSIGVGATSLRVTKQGCKKARMQNRRGGTT